MSQFLTSFVFMAELTQAQARKQLRGEYSNVNEQS